MDGGLVVNWGVFFIVFFFSGVMPRVIFRDGMSCA